MKTRPDIATDDYEALAAWLESDDFDPGPGKDAAPLREIRAAAQAADTARQHLHDTVRSARDAGMSWAAIGAMLGVSRQAAQQRFDGPARP